MVPGIVYKMIDKWAAEMTCILIQFEGLKFSP